MSKLITVFGATGAEGGGLARAILADPARRFRLRAVTRRPKTPLVLSLAQAGAEIVVADLDDEPSLQRAMDGAYGAFCVTNFWAHQSPQRELAQAQALARAARAAGLRHVIWSTLEDTREFALPGTRMPVLMGRYNVPHFDAKGEANRAFVELGVPTTFLYTSFYWDNLIQFGMRPRRLADGTLGLILPIGSTLLPGIAAEDIGACAHGILARGTELVGKSIGIAGEHLTGAQMAEALTLALGQHVEHVSPSPQQFAAQALPGAASLANMFQFKTEFAAAYCAARSPACTRELHPLAQTFPQWLARHRGQLFVS